VQAIVNASDPPSPAERDHLARLWQVLLVPIDQPAAPATPGQPSDARATTQPDAVLH